MLYVNQLFTIAWASKQATTKLCSFLVVLVYVLACASFQVEHVCKLTKYWMSAIYLSAYIFNGMTWLGCVSIFNFFFPASIHLRNQFLDWISLINMKHLFFHLACNHPKVSPQGESKVQPINQRPSVNKQINVTVWTLSRTNLIQISVDKLNFHKP